MFAAVTHGCKAGRHQEVLDEVYYPRIMHDNQKNFCFRNLGAIGADTAVLANFFTKLWDEPINSLTTHDRIDVVGWAGNRLSALGQLAGAYQAFQSVLVAKIKMKDWKNGAIAAGNLGDLVTIMGDLIQALNFADQSINLSNLGGDSFDKMAGLAIRANALHLSGRLSEAETDFDKAEWVQQRIQPQFSFLYSQAGFHYSDLLLSKGHYQEVLRRANQTLQWATQVGAGLLSFALDHLSLGRAITAAIRKFI